jgi:hypothetical protein
MASTLPFLVMTGKSTEAGGVDVRLASGVFFIFYIFVVIKNEVAPAVL